MDEWVLKTQKWLNKTYKGVDDYEECKENGRTGWNTIYSLREGLQHELKISPVASGFGLETERRLAAIIGKIEKNRNIVQLIQGAFWCKGINPSEFNGEFTSDTRRAISTLQRDAGVTINGVMTVPLMKALFDMSAFVLVLGGDTKIRLMQQYLNGKYHTYFGILPCDGIYQRETNTALITALQVEIKVSPTNGVYGPGAISKTPTLHQNDHGPVVKIVQYGLLVNGFYNGPFNGIFDSRVSSAIQEFCAFMHYPVIPIADLTVIKGLLTSNGNTGRDSIACDTSTQMNDRQISYLKAYGFSVVGRYLTGSVGVGSEERPKNLTVDEISRITKAGLSIFAIYQDGGWYQDYFTASNGARDAQLAKSAALRLGFPRGSTIYFACDVDIQDGDIGATVLPYMRAVSANLGSYIVGIYGTRNVCAKVIKDKSALYAFVSNMSTGYSGNLGFKMPKGWAFDQFIEYPIYGMPIDQVASSHLDEGVTKFKREYVSNEAALKELLKNTSITASFGKKIKLFDNGWYSLSFEAQEKSTIGSALEGISINNGKISSVDVNSWVSKNKDAPPAVIKAVISEADGMKITSKVKSGMISVSQEVKGNTLSSKITFVVYDLETGPIENSISLNFEASIKINDIPDNGQIVTTQVSWKEVLEVLIVILTMALLEGRGIQTPEEAGNILNGALNWFQRLLTGIRKDK